MAFEVLSMSKDFLDYAPVISVVLIAIVGVIVLWSVMAEKDSTDGMQVAGMDELPEVMSRDPLPEELGGQTEQYAWAQTPDTIEMRIPVDEETSDDAEEGKQLCVYLQKAKKTTKKAHWPCAIKGHVNVASDKYGPPRIDLRQ